MAGFAGFLNPKIKKYKPSKMDLLAAAIMSTVANGAAGIVKDTAVSGGQILNESVNQNGAGLGPFFQPAAMLLKQYGGQDALAKLVGRVNSDAGRSMRGEVTPMDVVNVASVMPIPVGGAARLGLAGLKLGAKAERGLLGARAFELGPSAGRAIYHPSRSARIAEKLMRNPISANYLNNAPELALNAPAVVDTWKSDLSTDKKAALTAAIILGTSIGGIKDTAKLGLARRAARKDTQNIKPASRFVRTEQRGSSATSDITMAMDTNMPLEALVAFSGSQPGYRTKFYSALYDNNSEFKNIVDLFDSGKISVDQAHKLSTDLTKKLPAGSGIGLKRRNWEYWDKKKKTGSFVNNPSDPNTSKLNTLYDTLTGKPSATTIPWDTKEAARALALYRSGVLSNGRIKTGTKKEEIDQLRKMYFDWYKKNVLLSDNPWVMQSARERLYGSSGVNDINIY